MFTSFILAPLPLALCLSFPNTHCIVIGKEHIPRRRCTVTSCNITQQEEVSLLYYLQLL